MDKQLSTSNKSQTNQTKHWSDAELRRATRVFDLLIRIDKRIKKGTSNELSDNDSKLST